VTVTTGVMSAAKPFGVRGGFAGVVALADFDVIELDSFDELHLNKQTKGGIVANAKFVIYKDQGDKYRWRLVAPNGQTTASSGQHFASHFDARRAAEEVREHAATAEIVEE